MGLTRGPLSEFRRVERNVLIAELVDIYKLEDRAAISVIEIILEGVQSKLEKGYLCNFLFDNNHKRWAEFYFMLAKCRSTHIAVPLMIVLLRRNSVSDIIAYWHVLLKSIGYYQVRQQMKNR